MKKIILKVIQKLGYTLNKSDKSTVAEYKDIKDNEFWEIYNLCSPFTMTSTERMYALYNSVNYILNNNIKGDFVECGVWRGGSAMLIAKMLNNKNITDRKIYLYDTFEGMVEPTKNDVDLIGKSASIIFQEKIVTNESSTWCLADLSDVKANLKLTDFSEKNLVYIKGKVENTIPQTVPNGSIALLRLDTDWYESTKHEMNYLYPKLENNGILIIDDYGHWEGCKKAIDEYFSINNINILLNRIDYTCRVGIKILNKS
ncbi:MAG: TylF/MycF/NovP-related O-methyltransferase [Bacteroidota bacterium]